MSTILQVSGIALISAGAFIAWPPLGIALFGIGVLLFGLAMERGSDVE
jgi:hypothetical protein